jgi:hypothetical protein
MNLTETAVEAKTTGQLRKYGLLMASAFGVVTALLVLRGRVWVYTAVPSAAFLLFALVHPKALSPIEKYWMKLAAVMGFIMTNVLLVLVYIVAIVPTGLILRIFGKNSVRKGFQPDLNSYWVDVDPDGSSSRPNKPY